MFVIVVLGDFADYVVRVVPVDVFTCVCCHIQEGPVEFSEALDVDFERVRVVCCVRFDEENSWGGCCCNSDWAFPNVVQFGVWFQDSAEDMVSYIELRDGFIGCAASVRRGSGSACRIS